MKLIPWLAGGHEREEGGEIIPILTPSKRENLRSDLNFWLHTYPGWSNQYPI